MMKRKIEIYSFSLMVALITSNAASADPHFTIREHFDISGNRAISADLDFKGVAADRMTVFVVYSDDRDEVIKSFDMRRRTGREPSGKANCRLKVEGYDDVYTCGFVFPHSDYLHPNASDSNSTVYRPGKLVYYSWAKKFRPHGATSDLTLQSDIQEIRMPRPMTIALLGDSYASGEGAPNRHLIRNLGTANGLMDDGEGMWDDKICHRSKRGGLEQGVKKFKDSHTHIQVDYINVTCGGATIGDGLITNQIVDDDTTAPLDPQNRRPGGSKPAQIGQVLDWLDRQNYPVLDALVMSAGGNDVGFDGVVMACLMDVLGDCANEVKPKVREALAELGEDYGRLNTALITEFQQRGKAIGKVFITEYPDPTMNADGRSCSSGLTRGRNPFNCWGLLEG